MNAKLIAEFNRLWISKYRAIIMNRCRHFYGWWEAHDLAGEVYIYALTRFKKKYDPRFNNLEKYVNFLVRYAFAYVIRKPLWFGEPGKYRSHRVKEIRESNFATQNREGYNWKHTYTCDPLSDLIVQEKVEFLRAEISRSKIDPYLKKVMRLLLKGKQPGEIAKNCNVPVRTAYQYITLAHARFHEMIFQYERN